MDNNLYHIVSIKDVNEQQILSKKHFSDKEYLSHTIESIKEGVIICNNNVITLFNNTASEIIIASINLD